MSSSNSGCWASVHRLSVIASFRSIRASSVQEVKPCRNNRQSNPSFNLGKRLAFIGIIRLVRLARTATRVTFFSAVLSFLCYIFCCAFIGCRRFCFRGRAVCRTFRCRLSGGRFRRVSFRRSRFGNRRPGSSRFVRHGAFCLHPIACRRLFYPFFILRTAFRRAFTATGIVQPGKAVLPHHVFIIVCPLLRFHFHLNGQVADIFRL